MPESVVGTIISGSVRCVPMHLYAGVYVCVNLSTLTFYLYLMLGSYLTYFSCMSHTLNLNELWRSPSFSFLWNPRASWSVKYFEHPSHLHFFALLQDCFACLPSILQFYLAKLFAFLLTFGENTLLNVLLTTLPPILSTYPYIRVVRFECNI